MSESHQQVKYDGNIVSEKTILWSNKLEEKKEILLKIFSQNCWKVISIDNPKACHWKINVESPLKSYKLNLYISSIRDEDRAVDEFKTQLGGIDIESNANGWKTIVMGIYTIDNNGDSKYILASIFDIDSYNFGSNPSIRLARTRFLQNAQVNGFCKGDNSFVFRPDFLYYYLDNFLDYQPKDTDTKSDETPKLSYRSDSINYIDIISAIKVKPFLLLVGISGTGKSQKVQELAFMTCPKKLRNEDSTTPGNYCLIEVKPNWHDSSELLGYYSALSGKYELRDFIRYAYKAIQNPNTPFFLCLDEMNLAPVEQYFAEYLSVLETRKRVGEDIETQPLLTKEIFSNCELQKYTATDGDGVITKDGKGFNMTELYSESDRNIIKYLKDNGLHLPSNLFVIGTVNMDDTTHQFSRKVIDRAFTIEMNGGKMANMFSDESRFLLEYRENPIALGSFKSEFVRANEVLEDDRFMKYANTIKEQVPLLLGDSDGKANEDTINGILNKTPFRVSYRVQNELVLYLSVLIENAGFPEDITSLIHEATLAILLEKVLPRVQGEQKQLETKNGGNVLKDMKTFVENHFKPITEDKDEISRYSKVLCKLDEMDKKLDNYYTNFF